LFNSEISVLINLLLGNVARRYNFPPLKIKSRCENRLQTLSADDDKEGIFVEERKKCGGKRKKMRKREREREQFHIIV
jgi:hypothetical protein